MTVQETTLKGCFIIQPTIFEDERGYFFESFNEQKFEEKIGSINFVQDNESLSTYGVIRGLHLQSGAYAQSKLVRVVKGEVLDVAVDFRKSSPTFGQSFSILLSEQNKKQLFIPKGFLHGFAVLSKTAIFSYKCDHYYHRPSELGIRYDEPTFNIDWKIPSEDIILSEKDVQLPFLKDLEI